MEFEWDEAKNRTNVLKHGIDFETARRIFDGPVLSRRDSCKDYGEVRYITIGRVGDTGLIVLAHTDRGGRVRLISARPASRKERQAWHAHIR